MFRTPFLSQMTLFVRSVRAPVLAAVLATGFVIAPVTIADTQAGNSGISARKLKGKPSGNSVRTIRLGGDNLSLRPVSRSLGENRQTISKRKLGDDTARTYHRKRSVLDGHYGEAKPVHRYTSHGRLDNIRRYGKIEHGSSAESRSGVVYNSGQSLRNKRKHSGLHQIAGHSDSGIASRSLSGAKPMKRAKHDRYTKGELIAIGVAVNGYYEIAGGGQGSSNSAASDDCAYGTYCTIDLGGPKIITYNDTGDIRDGQLADDAHSDEEYLK